jgi:hypothetical protein
MANLDLPLLTALMLIKNWKINLRLITLIADPAWMEKARHYLNDLMVLAHMPNGYKIIVARKNLV